jgi:hypothetical protein
MTRFWALVDNSRNLKKNRTYGSTLWWKLYGAFFILLAAAGFAYSLYSGSIGPFSLLAFIPAFLLFFAFFTASSQISREWKGQTITWWLAIPCSRSELLSAKMLGALVRLIKITVVSAVAMAILVLGGILVKPDIWTMPAISTAAIMTLKLYMLTIVVSPLAIAMGMFFAIIIRSRLKPLSPFITAFVISAFAAGTNYLLPIFGKVEINAQSTIVPQIAVLYFPFTTIILRVVLMLLIAAVVFVLSSYLLAEQTEV